MKWLLFAWKNLRRNRRRTLLAVLITAVGTASVLIGGGFALYTYDSLRELNARDSGHVVVAAAGHFAGDEDVPLQHGLADAPALAADLASLPGVRAVLARVQFSGLISNGDKSAVFVGSGVEPEPEFRMRGPQINLVAGDALATGGGIPQVVIGDELARLMKAQVGTSLTLLSTTTDGALNAQDVVVTGLVATGVPEIDRRLVMADLTAVQSLLLSDKVSTLSVYLRDTNDTEATAAAIRTAHPALEVRTWEDLAVFYTAVRALYNRIFGILGAIMVIIILFAMSNTLGMAVVERTREIGTLRALGTQPGEIVRNFVLEGGLIGALGALAGVGFALGTIVFLAFANIQMPPPPGRSNTYPLYVNFSPELTAMTIAAVVAVAALAAWRVSAKAARKPITEALAHV